MIQRYYEREYADMEYQRTEYVPVNFEDFNGTQSLVKNIIETLVKEA